MRDLIEALNRAHRLDDRRRLHEAAPKRVDAQGLQTNLPIVIKRLLSQLPYNLQYQKLTGRINGREFHGRLSLIPGDSTHSVWKFNDESDNVTTIDLSFFYLPTNCEITAELLEDQYGKTILDAIQYNFVSSDKMSSRGDLHRSLEQRFINAIKPLEAKYHVTLYPSFYPSPEEFQQHGGYIYAHVTLTGVEGKSGQLQKQESGYYEYVVDGVSYSSYLRWKDHSIVAATIKETEEVDFNKAVVKVETHLRELLPMIDKLDNILANEPVAEKNMADFIASLTSKYPEATITLDRGSMNWHPRSFIVKYVEGPNQFEKTIAVEDVLNSFEKVKKGIQQKIYRTRKAPPKPSWMRQDTGPELNFESYNIYEALNRAHRLDEAAFGSDEEIDVTTQLKSNSGNYLIVGGKPTSWLLGLVHAKIAKMVEHIGWMYTKYFRRLANSVNFMLHSNDVSKMEQAARVLEKEGFSCTIRDFRPSTDFDAEPYLIVTVPNSYILEQSKNYI